MSQENIQPTVARLASSARHVGGATLVSRVLGFARDILIARFFGTGAAAEAFVVGFRIPNLFRELVAEGAASAAFVPTLSAARTTDTPQRWSETVSVLVTTMAVVLGVAVCLAMMVAPLLVRLLAPGFADDGSKWALTIRLTRVLLPYLWMMGLVAVTTSALHVLRHFRVPAWSPAIMNACIIITCLVWVPGVTPAQGMVLIGVGILTAGVLQVALNVVMLARKDTPLHVRWDWHRLELAHIGRLMVPRIFGAAVYQLGVLLDTIMASLAWIVGHGGVAALYYASRLVQFPLGLFGISIVTVALPTLAHQAAANDYQAFRTTVLISVRTMTAVMLPSTVGLYLLSEPVVALLFERGAFDATSTWMTRWAVQWSVLGLWSYAVTKLFVNAHYALHDTKTPVRWALQGLGLNLLFNLLLMYPMGVGGLALGTAMASTIECVGLWRSIEARVGVMDRQVWWGACRRIGIATAVMGLWTWWSWRRFGLEMVPWLGMLVVIASSIVVYYGVARWLKVDELQWMVQRISKHK